ncbi:unnamed protein product [Cuscuta campestris]|uniref:DUF7906 domain-containing protein n=1 Tax=Cuscuta campestris TaxID=132261 RepID=A0A484NH07_9ASTE|nr:unnamed protein product [Cuscuta campestris]
MMISYLSSRPFFIACLIVLLLGDGSHGYSTGSQKNRGFSVFSLFNLKEKSRFWSESVIRTDMNDLEVGQAKADMINFTKAGNIANYLKLLEIDSMYLPIPVNFIFIGFEGKGNLEFKLQPEELERWFTKIDHIFEHTRIPQIGEVLTPFYKINIDREQRHHLPLISHLSYNFSVHAIQMGEKVTSIFERAINVFGRKNNVLNTSDDGDDLWQVDVDMMDVVYNSLVEYLQLEAAYNIFILNPKHTTKRVKYGYRRGLSETEINFLKENKELQSKILQSESVSESFLALDKMKRPLYDKHPMAKFSWTVTEERDTVEWCDRCLDVLNNVENLSQEKDAANIIHSKVMQILKGKGNDMQTLFYKELKSGNLSGLHAECLTDTWVGNSRWAFIDLSAGPFSWGPAVGGEGVRTELSLPSVEKTLGAVAEISEEEAEDILQEAIQEKFAVFGDMQKEHQAIDILLAEIDIYELFAFKHCKGRRVKLALCEELDERMRDLKNELQSFDGEEYDENHKVKALDALKRMENWNLFSDNQEDFQNYTVARDTFLAHLGATLWGSMRHIISPSLADGAFHYYEKLSFQLFFITQEKVRNIKLLPVDLKSITEGLSMLKMPSQKVMFSQHMIGYGQWAAIHCL